MIPEPQTWAPLHNVKLETDIIHAPFASTFSFIEDALKPKTVEQLSPIKSMKRPRTEFSAEFYAAGNEDGPNPEMSAAIAGKGMAAVIAAASAKK